MEKHPLVSVIVVCYNAAEYILETLESVKAQTYKNIELIVSDDCSNDGTLEIAKKWIAENKNEFVRTETISVSHNTGVSANYNRAVKACEGIWIKNVDGDDLLSESCIQENIEYVNNNSDVNIVFSNAHIFKGKNIKNIIGECIPNQRKSFFDLKPEEQFRYLLNVNILPSQTCFVKRKLLERFPYNEKYIALEDAPMWVNLTRYGYKIHYFDSYTAYYRKDDSMTLGRERFFSPAYVESTYLFFWSELYNYIKDNNLQEAYNNNKRFHLTIEIAFGIFKNRKTKVNDIIFKFLRKLIYKYVYYKL